MVGAGLVVGGYFDLRVREPGCWAGGLRPGSPAPYLRRR